MGARRGKQRKDTIESGEDSDEYRKKRDRNNLVCSVNFVHFIMNDHSDFRQ